MSSIAAVTPTICQLMGVEPPGLSSAEALQRVLGETFNEAYAAENRVIAFCPDQGTHVDPATGKGAHRTDAADDVDVRHFWGINRGG
jgi:hypothetical protein